MLPLAFLGLFFAWPVLAIVSLGLREGGVVSAFFDGETWELVGFTLGQALASTVVAVVAGLPVAFVLARLTGDEAAESPWHRVVAADARISRGMDADLAANQRALLEAEGMVVDEKGFIRDPDRHFHAVGIRREIRWDAE